MNTIGIRRNSLDLLEQYRVQGQAQAGQQEPRCVQRDVRNQLVDMRVIGKSEAFTRDLAQAGRAMKGMVVHVNNIRWRQTPNELVKRRRDEGKELTSSATIGCRLRIVNSAFLRLRVDLHGLCALSIVQRMLHPSSSVEAISLWELKLMAYEQQSGDNRSQCCPLSLLIETFRHT